MGERIMMWWNSVGKSYIFRALHTLWESVGGMVAMAVLTAVTVAIPSDFNIDVFFSNIAHTDWRLVVGGSALAAVASILKSIKVGTPETREKTNE